MIVVTGTPRSGTSFVMCTLKKMGYPIVGERLLPEHGPKEYNPDGYWELPISEIFDGVQGNQFEGKAIKLFGLYANLSNVSNFEGLIFCSRNRKDSIRSLFRLIVAVGQFSGSVAWMIAEHSYDINRKHACDVYERCRCRKTVLSMDDGSLTEQYIKEFAQWHTPQQL